MITDSVAVDAFYREDSGRYALYALSMMNNTSKPASDLRVKIIPDHLVISGKEDLEIYDRKTGLIGRGESTSMSYRPTLDIDYHVKGDTIEMPLLLSSEYVDLFVGRVIDIKFDKAREKLGESPHYRNTPRIGIATYSGGPLELNEHGSCVS